MALVQCPECNRALSDKAVACPFCGYPLARPSRLKEWDLLIEKTRKRWKALRVLGWLLIAAGLMVLRGGWPARYFDSALVGWWVAGAGFACLITSKAGAWWYHG
jgi:hypothetical protein